MNAKTSTAYLGASLGRLLSDSMAPPQPSITSHRPLRRRPRRLRDARPAPRASPVGNAHVPLDARDCYCLCYQDGISFSRGCRSPTNPRSGARPARQPRAVARDRLAVGRAPSQRRARLRPAWSSSRSTTRTSLLNQLRGERIPSKRAPRAVLPGTVRFSTPSRPPPIETRVCRSFRKRASCTSRSAIEAFRPSRATRAVTAVTRQGRLTTLGRVGRIKV